MDANNIIKAAIQQLDEKENDYAIKVSSCMGIMSAIIEICEDIEDIRYADKKIKEYLDRCIEKISQQNHVEQDPENWQHQQK